jgi:gliding motility-associated-like protein
VTALDSNGCEDMDSVTILIIDPPLIKIPNIITPNGDDENETWNLIDIPDLFLYNIVITDRQGRRVYEAKDYQNDWNAVDQNGNALPNGVYFYYMKNSKTQKVYRGYIQVIR